MGRKSLAEKRINQILDAFEQGIIEHGVEGVSLQQTAVLAGVNLGMIHHYIGRRDDLLQAMVTRLGESAKAEMAELVTEVPIEARLPVLLDVFFEDDESRTSQLIDQLFAASERQPTIKALLREIHAVYVEIWAAEIGRLHPTASEAQCQRTAFTVLSLAYGSGILGSVGFAAGWQTAVKQTAERLISELTSA